MFLGCCILISILWHYIYKMMFKFIFLYLFIYFQLFLLNPAALSSSGNRIVVWLFFLTIILYQIEYWGAFLFELENLSNRNITVSSKDNKLKKIYTTKSFIFPYFLSFWQNVCCQNFQFKNISCEQQNFVLIWFFTIILLQNFFF